MQNDLISRSALKEKIHDFVRSYRTPKISKGDLEHGTGGKNARPKMEG